jgi:MoaA/NifB/PqqE/SkfB family radical SAM enzyme
MVKCYFNEKSRAPFFPQEIVIELTNHCNLACVMCPHSKMTRKKGFMDEVLFSKIIDEVKEHTELIYLHGTGESLLHKRLYEFTKYASSRGLTTCLSTNGTLMDEAACNRLLTCGLDYLIIAFDGGAKETYESIRVKGNFDTLIANIKSLLRVKSSIGSTTKVCLQMIYMEENADEIELFKNLFTQEEKRSVNQFRFKPLYETYALSQKSVHHTRPCYWLWNMMSIYWDGDVALCCMDADGAYNLGNAGRQKVSEIWNSLRARHRRLAYDDIPLCGTCDIPEQGYFSTMTILGSIFLSAAQVRDIIPLYEKHILLPFKSQFKERKRAGTL